MDKNEEKKQISFILLKNAYMPFSPRTEKKRGQYGYGHTSFERGDSVLP